MVVDYSLGAVVYSHEAEVCRMLKSDFNFKVQVAFCLF